LKPCVLRPKAREDRRHEVRHHRDRAGQGTALRLISAIETALHQLSRDLGIGSPAIGQSVEIEGLRRRRLTGFPLSLCYFELEGHFEVLRLVCQRMEAHRVDFELLDRDDDEAR